MKARTMLFQGQTKPWLEEPSQMQAQATAEVPCHYIWKEAHTHTQRYAKDLPFRFLCLPLWKQAEADDKA